jgi:hypothetical protein
MPTLISTMDHVFMGTESKKGSVDCEKGVRLECMFGGGLEERVV